MQRRGRAVLLFVLALVLLIPALSQAQGLVPCGIDDPTGCQACHLVSLAQNVVMFMIGLAVPIAAILFTYAGILYFTSGAGGQEQIGKAKNIFKTALLGFVLAITAWLIINTLLYTILDKDQYSNSSWFKIDCTADNARPRNTKIGDVLFNHLGWAPALVPVSAGSYTYNTCEDPTYKLESTPDGKSFCVSPDGKKTVPPIQKQAAVVKGGGGIGLCSEQALAGTFGGNAATMSCILQHESGCDISAGGDDNFSIGLAQINMTANQVFCNGEVLDCPSAFTGIYQCKRVGGGLQCGVYKGDTFLGLPEVKPGMQWLADKCEAKLKTSDCNLQTAKSVLNSGGLTKWTTFKKFCGG